jgi:hypothetical protein
MDKLTFYEQVGIVIPGSVLLAGLLFLFPILNAYVPKEGVTLGQFGICNYPAPCDAGGSLIPCLHGPQ